MPDRDVGTIKDLIYYQNAKIIAKSAFAASGGESGLKHRGDKKLYHSHPAASPIYRPRNCSGTADGDDVKRAGHRCCYSVRGMTRIEGGGKPGSHRGTTSVSAVRISSLWIPEK